MDWLGQSQYAEQTVYWSSLSSAVSEVVSFLETNSALVGTCKSKSFDASQYGVHLESLLVMHLPDSFFCFFFMEMDCA